MYELPSDEAVTVLRILHGKHDIGSILDNQVIEVSRNRSAIAIEAVRPGDSIPNKFTRLFSPWTRKSCIRKSFSRGPVFPNLGTTPAMSGSRQFSGMLGQYARAEASKVASRFGCTV